MTNQGRQQIQRTLEMVKECTQILFDHAPVMMHSINEDGALLNVNQRWSETMGYQAHEVLGRKSVEFLTDESRAQMQTDALHLFWRVGRAYSIGVELLRKNGRVLDVLLDAVAVDQTTGGRVGLATLRDSLDLDQWRQASMIIESLHGLFQAEQRLANLLVQQEGGHPETAEAPSHREEPDQLESTPETLKALSSILQNVLTNVRALADLEEQRRHLLVNKQQELSLLAETIEICLQGLAVENVPTP
ncbi:MAG: PAS domain S-box protein [Chloroflexi bacterium]|nr:PAS domain S-box protein [Chloroflexota bacterium]